MTWETGTASNYLDLAAKIRDFLVSDTTLVGASENWELVMGPASGTPLVTDEFLFKGPGLTGTDEIFVGLKFSVSVPGDYYNLGFTGTKGNFPAEPTLDLQPGRGPYSWMLCWNQPMTYWIHATGRRFVVTAKVSTGYTGLYAGLILPYSPPSSYLYPLFIGATSGSATERWGSSSIYNRGFSDPGNDGCSMLFPDGNWYFFENYGFNDVDRSYNKRAMWPNLPTAIYPFNSRGLTGSNENLNEVTKFIGKTFDGSYQLLDLRPTSENPLTGFLGIMDGVFWVTHIENSAENIITIDSQDYIVFQNMLRSGIRDYWALRLD